MQLVETNLQFNGSLNKRKSTNRAIIHSASPDVPASRGWHLGQVVWYRVPFL